MVEFKGFKVVKDGWDNRIASISDGERERGWEVETLEVTQCITPPVKR